MNNLSKFLVIIISLLFIIFTLMFFFYGAYILIRSLQGKSYWTASAVLGPGKVENKKIRVRVWSSLFAVLIMLVNLKILGVLLVIFTRN